MKAEFTDKDIIEITPQSDLEISLLEDNAQEWQAEFQDAIMVSSTPARLILRRKRKTD